MDILRIKEHIREFFNCSGGNELPCFPEAIQCPSFHPDFFLASLVEAPPYSLFAFQMLNKISANHDFFANAVPGFIWQFNHAGTNDLLSKVTALLLKVSESLEKDGLKAYFSMVTADHMSCGICSRGATWDILLNGVTVGKVNVFSELAGSCLKTDLVTVHMDLGLILDFAQEASVTTETDSLAVNWSQKFELGQLLSQRFYDLNSNVCNSQIDRLDELLKPIEECSKSEYDDGKAFVQILTCLNLYKGHEKHPNIELANKWLVSAAERVKEQLFTKSESGRSGVEN